MYFLEKLGKLELTTGIVLHMIVWTLVLAVVFTPVGTALSANATHITVTIIADGQEWEFSSTSETVKGALQEAGVGLGSMDRTYPKPDTKLYEGLKIRVTRVTQKEISQTEQISYKTRIKFDPRGTTDKVVLQNGKPGQKTVKYLVTYKDGVKTAAKVVGAQVTVKPVDEIVAVSNPRHLNLVSRSGSRIPCIRMKASAYAPFVCGGSKSGRTATGVMAGKGIAAVDPRVIPLGTKLYIDGYGYATAADTGGAIKGNRIDLCYDTYRQAIQFGRRTVNVYILEK